MSEYYDKEIPLEERECAMTFGNPYFRGILATEQEREDQDLHEDYVKGYNLKYTSNEPC